MHSQTEFGNEKKKVRHLIKIQSEKTVKPKGVTYPLNIYEVEGIAGQYNRYFQKKKEVFLFLSEALPLIYTRVNEKNLGDQQFRGRLVKLSGNRALIYCDVEKILVPEPLDNLKLNFFLPKQSTITEAIYAKVLSYAIYEKSLYI